MENEKEPSNINSENQSTLTAVPKKHRWKNAAHEININLNDCSDEEGEKEEGNGKIEKEDNDKEEKVSENVINQETVSNEIEKETQEPEQEIAMQLPEELPQEIPAPQVHPVQSPLQKSPVFDSQVSPCTQQSSNVNNKPSTPQKSSPYLSPQQASPMAHHQLTPQPSPKTSQPSTPQQVQQPSPMMQQPSPQVMLTPSPQPATPQQLVHVPSPQQQPQSPAAPPGRHSSRYHQSDTQRHQPYSKAPTNISKLQQLTNGIEQNTNIAAYPPSHSHQPIPPQAMQQLPQNLPPAPPVPSVPHPSPVPPQQFPNTQQYNPPPQRSYHKSYQQSKVPPSSTQTHPPPSAAQQARYFPPQPNLPPQYYNGTAPAYGYPEQHWSQQGPANQQHQSLSHRQLHSQMPPMHFTQPQQPFIHPAYMQQTHFNQSQQFYYGANYPPHLPSQQMGGGGSRR